MNPDLLSLKKIGKSFPRIGNDPLVVLDDVDLQLKSGEIVSLLGRSGSGKSTLLRIISGLIEASSGDAEFKGRAIRGPSGEMAMVFQSFALFPWLTVLENVELGLIAMEVPRDESKKRARHAIELIGLSGFENAYPRELSGGMRQRVGFARALVVQPTLLLMDEPFSALDVLTAETLRTDFLDLWVEGRMPIKSVLLVTHNIEEAVLMCDRILIFSSNPGRIAEEVRVNLPHPRNRLDPTFRKIVDSIYAKMTTHNATQSFQSDGAFPGLGLGMVLPDISTNLMSGLIENLAQEHKGRADLPVIAAALQLEVDNLLHLAETLQLLRFVEVSEGDIALTAAGTRYANMSSDDRKDLFADHLLAYVPLAAHMRRVLEERPDRSARISRFLEELEDYMTEDNAKESLKAVIAWGRYAEIFSYSESATMVVLLRRDAVTAAP